MNNQLQEKERRGARWIATMPADYKLGLIKAHCTLHGRIGWQGLTANEYRDEGAYLVTGTDFKDGVVDWTTCFHITEKRYNEDANIHIHEGDLLITKDGTIGKVAIAKNCPQQVSLNSGIMLIKNKTKRYLSEFLRYVLLSDVFWNWYNSNQRGNSTIKHLYQEQFSFFIFPNPPIQKQKKIVAYLDEKIGAVDALIANLNSQIDELERCQLSTITEAVTRGISVNEPLRDSGIKWEGSVPQSWRRIRIKDHTYLKGRIGWQGLKHEDFIESGPYCITGTDFNPDASINWETCYHVSEKRYMMDSAIQVRNGDLLITKDGTVGKLAFVENLPDKACLNSHLLIIRVVDGAYDIRFLFYVLKSKLLRDYLDIEKNGTVMDSLTQEMFGNFSFYIPDISTQKEIAAYLDKRCASINDMIAIKQQKIDELKRYRASLIYECVTGKKEVG